MTLLKALCVLLLPPLAVYLHTHECSDAFWINCILTLCGHIPGVIHALFVVTNPATHLAVA
jgi:uncharacterized membrane protein YqaE (UPF0057 family)